MIEQVRAHVAEKLQDLDGVVGLRQTGASVAPHLFREGDDLSQLVLSPAYPLALTVSLLHKRYGDVRLGIVARGCDARALVEVYASRARDIAIDDDDDGLVTVARCRCSGGLHRVPDPDPEKISVIARAIDLDRAHVNDIARVRRGRGIIPVKDHRGAARGYGHAGSGVEKLVNALCGAGRTRRGQQGKGRTQQEPGQRQSAYEHGAQKNA